MVISSLLLKLICVNKIYSHDIRIRFPQPDPIYHRQNILYSCYMLPWLAPGACKGIPVKKVCYCYKVFDHYYALQIRQFSNHYKQVTLPPW